jgi:hypothetical protein
MEQQVEIYFPQKWTWLIVETWIKSRYPSKYQDGHWYANHLKKGVNSKNFRNYRQWCAFIFINNY